MNELDDINRHEDAAFILFDRTDAPQFFVDGLSQVMFGFPVSKLIFHSLIRPPSGDKKEIRKVELVLTLSTLAMFDMAQTIARVAHEGGSAIDAFSKAHTDKLQAFLADTAALSKPTNQE